MSCCPGLRAPFRTPERNGTRMAGMTHRAPQPKEQHLPSDRMRCEGFLSTGAGEKLEGGLHFKTSLTGWLKYDSLNSRSLQIFKPSSQKAAAVIKNPKQHRSLSLPYCPLPKEGRKVSVAPSLWEICVTPLPPGSVTMFPSMSMSLCPPAPTRQHTVFPVQQLSVNAAAAK